ncbi:MAG: hypothetical protein WC836_08840 [Desulfobacula sp.]|jgi:hypothetical protein
MKSVYFTKNGKAFDMAHAFVEKEYVTRKMLAEGKTIPTPDEYIIVFDLSNQEFVGVLGIIEQRDGRLPFQDSFSGVVCENHAIEFVRFVIKRMIPIEEKIEIGRKLFEAAVNWYILTSKIHQIDIDCYLETHSYVIDFFNKTTKKDTVFFPIPEAVFKNNSSLSKNSMGFLKDASVYKINTVDAICPEYKMGRKVA